MKHKLLLTLLMLVWFVSASAQQNLQFSIVSFGQDRFDGTAKNKLYEKIDGSGSRYAIIKVTSTRTDDDLRAYRFNFGNLNSFVENHEGELWVYVQRNAKLVTISRDGYTPINKHDLGLTIEAGETYNMQLSSAGKVVYHQMLMFNLKPAIANAIVMIKEEGSGNKEEIFGTTDEQGMVAKSLELGTYTYRIMADNYHSSEGRLTLDDRTQTHIEEVQLKSNHAEITLTVDADADIYINKEKRGTRQWKGILKAGTYEVNCRQPNHQPTTRYITVEENSNQSIALEAPTPITGSLSITSRPLGASIAIDGKDYGTTPRIVNDLLIGQHSVTLTKDSYDTKTQAFEVKEGELTEISMTMAFTGMPTTTTPSVQQLQNFYAKEKNTDLTQLIQKNNKKAKRLKRAGWWTGSLLCACGAFLTAGGVTSNEDDGLWAFATGLSVFAGGVATTTACVVRAHKIKKENSKYVMQTASLCQHDFTLKNGTSLSPSINLLKDNTRQSPTLGFGLCYTF